MITFKHQDVLKLIDEQIDSDPLVTRIKLDESETIDFLDKVPELYNVGRLDFKYSLDKTEYLYRKVLIEVSSNARLMLG